MQKAVVSSSLNFCRLLESLTPKWRLKDVAFNAAFPLIPLVAYISVPKLILFVFFSRNDCESPFKWEYVGDPKETRQSVAYIALPTLD